KLPFVDPDDVGVVVHLPDEFVGVPHVDRGDPHVAVRHDVVFAVAVVDERFEDLDLLPGDLRAAQPPDELFALAAEHAAGDDFNPAAVAPAPTALRLVGRGRGGDGIARIAHRQTLRRIDRPA